MVYRFLYVDSDPVKGAQVEMFFESDRQVGSGSNFFLVRAQTYKQALKILAATNAEEDSKELVGKKRQRLKPIDFILFEIKPKDKQDKYSWHEFLENIFSLGLARLGLSFGSLIAFGSLSESEKDYLLAKAVKLMSRPFTVNDLKLELINHIIWLEGSPRYSIDRTVIESNERVEIVRRTRRYYCPPGTRKIASQGLPYHKNEKDVDGNFVETSLAFRSDLGISEETEDQLLNELEALDEEEEQMQL